MFSLNGRDLTLTLFFSLKRDVEDFEDVSEHFGLGQVEISIQIGDFGYVVKN